MGRQSIEEEERDYFLCRIEEVEDDMKCGILTKEMPRLEIVKYHDLLDKLWGWDNLLPMGDFVSWSDYTKYLEEYHGRNVGATSSIASLTRTCLEAEKQLCEMINQMKSKNLPMRKLSVLSCLIHKCVDSFSSTCISSEVHCAALLCIAKEADLTCQLLKCGADPVDDYWINQGSDIRTCALILMNCTSDGSVPTSALLLGMAKEAEMMCAWVSENKKPVDFSDFDVPDEVVNSRTVRYQTLNVMVTILEKSAAAAWCKIDNEEPASDGVDITADGAANTTGVGISDVLNSHCEKMIEGGESRKKMKMTEGNREEEHLQKLGEWERLRRLSGSVKWDGCRSYLQKYYTDTASEFPSGAPANQNPEDSQSAYMSDMYAFLVKSCFKMEDKLLLEWKTRVSRSINDTLPVSTLIQSSLIKELALSIYRTDGELFSLSGVALMCITNEADLMCELLKHGTEPFDDIIEQSSVIRMCAFGLASLKGHGSIYAAATAMLNMANEAKKACDWIKTEKKLVSFSFFEPHDLDECRLNRFEALGVMTNILQDSFLPCSKVSRKYYSLHPGLLVAQTDICSTKTMLDTSI